MKEKVLFYRFLLVLLLIIMLVHYFNNKYTYIGEKEDLVGYLLEQEWPLLDENDIYHIEQKEGYWLALYENKYYDNYYGFVCFKKLLPNLPYYEKVVEIENNKDNSSIYQANVPRDNKELETIFYGLNINKDKDYTLTTLTRNPLHEMGQESINLEKTFFLIKKSEKYFYRLEKSQSLNTNK